MSQIDASPATPAKQVNHGNWGGGSMARDAATDFLSGLLTHDNVMIALIDLPTLLSGQEIAVAATAQPS